jgi:peptidoglycan hydrolase-like protein with peptidoglycan-binding domain
VISVQKTLASLGYGPMRVDGTLSPEMRQAIERFELDRGLPVTGRVHERLIRELERVTGSRIG